jgi:hypothetical protein
MMTVRSGYSHRQETVLVREKVTCGQQASLVGVLRVVYVPARICELAVW